MAEVIIYSTTVCPFCIRAKALLSKKKVAFQEINLTEHPDRREEMISRANGRRTVPQIFINGQHVGGCDDLHELEAAGELDQLLAG
ncbi:glutaredoxin 3 [Candidatus Magnetaquicoccus inordinatus]|uniref:glutaredoxin 3 n=1 Tax=Candidatus Magnetaquicoccus inordinatus TaxID=2496818 RepID=UPI00102B95EF|nr:glutaredoxin 3 [Candidatus Magnetaquicoccus inordinatus]